jgi:hypothetical protein
MAVQRHYPQAEYERTIGQPLSTARLAAIWRTLDERERLGFILSLDETIADRVIELCSVQPAQPAKE